MEQKSKDLTGLLSRLPKWVQTEVGILKRRVEELENELKLAYGVGETRITYGYECDGRGIGKIPDNRGPIHFAVGGTRFSVSIGAMGYPKSGAYLQVRAVDGYIAVLPEGSNAVRIQRIDE
jgi:hypothetical protein